MVLLQITNFLHLKNSHLTQNQTNNNVKTIFFNVIFLFIFLEIHLLVQLFLNFEKNVYTHKIFGKTILSFFSFFFGKFSYLIMTYLCKVKFFPC
jgi:hypothetical protein